MYYRNNFDSVLYRRHFPLKAVFSMFRKRVFAEFERKVYDDAGSSCTDLLSHGLLSLVASDTIWATLPYNTTMDNNVSTTIPRNTYPTPLQPADNATTGVVKLVVNNGDDVVYCCVVGQSGPDGVVYSICLLLYNRPTKLSLR